MLPTGVFVGMNPNVYGKLGCTNLQLKGHKVTIVGQITLAVRVGECRHDVTFFVMKQGDPVLSKDVCVLLSLEQVVCMLTCCLVGGSQAKHWSRVYEFRHKSFPSVGQC